MNFKLFQSISDVDVLSLQPTFTFFFNSRVIFLSSRDSA